ncbi:MAG: hypothetical protein ABUT20_55170, partial [Bacteroidota bacterium]
ALGIEDFFQEGSTVMKKFRFPQTFKNHKIEELLILSGIYKIVEKEMGDIAFKGHWSKVGEWSENSRYLTGNTKETVENFLISVKEIATWIQKN